ncbi:ribosome small subunit-dependent GTPase A [Nocardiopsis trehalosi]|uniref:ribosome small subunit-dependent GTPase A n=1 Tax=Nocardiopsis trehalosi TaxID=109329 RepID=UPI0008345089|nr:ribosome small subunit-dependent GTPase A [Nocardiopsis trehalosi]
MFHASDPSSAPASPGGLAAYGWDPALDALFAPHRAAGLVPARVVQVDRGSCTAATADGHVRAATTGLPEDGPAPCTGDWAALRPGDRPALAALLPRRTAVVRASASRRSDGQVLAANVDTVVVVASLAVPLDLGRIERLLALAWESGAVPVVALTQADLADDPDAALSAAATAAPGAEVRVVSAVTGEGMDALAAALGGTVVLVGTSGAGKSTLGNALLGADVLATGEVRARDGKGRHTTVRRELLPLPSGGVLIDTPGLRGVGLHAAADGLERAFADIEELARDCRFADCGHTAEPGCAVLAAIEAGDLPRRRLDSMRRLERENAWAESRTDARLRAERRGREKEITRFQRDLYRSRGRR